MEPTAGAAWDLGAALNAVDDDRELLCRMIELFVKQSHSLVQATDAALARGDCVAVERAAHTLRGSVCNFGAKKAFEAASRVEHMARRKDLAGAAQAHVALAAALRELEPSLMAFCTETPR